ncbi:hypothetical protein ACT4S5_18485 [Kocuria oceani]|uniref:hypothetical protein n=1 Tax=Kocuria oceani TaxID=988827 RepID=UPI0040354831
MRWLKAAGGGGAAGDAVADAGVGQALRDDAGVAVEELLPGQPVQARVRGVVHWSGTVETVSVPLAVVWILEDGLGERKLLDLREYQVNHQDTTDR